MWLLFLFLPQINRILLEFHKFYHNVVNIIASRKNDQSTSSACNCYFALLDFITSIKGFHSN